jgi:hypothetical protein
VSLGAPQGCVLSETPGGVVGLMPGRTLSAPQGCVLGATPDGVLGAP